MGGWKMIKKLIGTWGEERAADYLRGKGYRIVATGYRSRYGEIDLIAADQDYVAFVEVKTRKDGDFSEAWEAVNRQKQRKLRQTAQLWLIENESELQPRFDIMEVYAPLGVDTKDPKIVHWEDAFQ